MFKSIINSARYLSEPLFLFKILLFLFVLVVSLYYPLLGDDLGRLNNGIFEHIQGNWYKHTIRPLNHMLRSDYQIWTGRLSAQALVYITLNRLYLNLACVISSIITAVFYLLFNQYICRGSFYDKQIPYKNYIFCGLAFIFYSLALGDFKEVFINKTITIQYFWGMVSMMYVIGTLSKRPFGFVSSKFPNLPTNLSQFKANKGKSSFPLNNMGATAKGVLLLLLLISGLLLGLYNEILSAMFIGVLGIRILMLSNYKFSNINKILRAKPLLFFLIGLLGGFLLMVIAPGTHKRKIGALMMAHDRVVNYSIYDKLFFPFIHYYDIEIKRYISAVVLALFMICIYKRYSGIDSLVKLELDKKFKIIIALIISFALSLLLLSSFAYYYEEKLIGRVTIVSDILLFILLFRTSDFLGVFNRNWMQYLISAVNVLYPLYFVLAIYASSIEWQFNQDRISLIQSTVNHDQQDFTLASFRCDDNILKIWRVISVSNTAITNNPIFAGNTIYAQVYGAKSVTEKEC